MDLDTLNSDKKNSKNLLDKNVDIIETTVGNFGRYQWFLCVLVKLGGLSTVFHMFNNIFILPPASYVCADDNVTNSCPCSSPMYDRSVFQETVITQWDLICDRRWMVTLSQTAIFIGIVFGTVVFGILSDKFGRRIILIVAFLIQTLGAIGITLSPNIWVFICLRLLIGTAVGGCILVGAVYLLEFCGISFRAVVMIITNCIFMFGYFICGAMAYRLRDWKKLLFWSSAPWSIFVLLYIWLLPESPRWLITHGKSKKAIKLLIKIAKINKFTTCDIFENVRKYETNMQTEKWNLLNMFKIPIVRKYTITAAILFMASTILYYGTSQYLTQLRGNLFDNVIYSYLIAVLQMIVLAISVIYFERSSSIFTLLALSAASVVGFSLLSESFRVIKVILISIIQNSSALVLVILLLYGSEIFPTVLRNSAMGVACTCGRIGAVLSPYIANIGVEWITMTCFFIVAIIGCCLVFILPRTKNKALLNTIHEEFDISRDCHNDECEKIHS